MKYSAFLIRATAGLTTAALICASSASAKVFADSTGLALDRVLSPAVQPLEVTSPAAQPGQPIPAAYTALGKDVSPPVAWDSAPPGVGSYVVIMEDSNSASGTPVLHWMAYNIPPTVNGLAKNVHNRETPKGATGMMQGINSLGGVGYVGPQLHPGDPPHHYHIEVFALDRMLNIGPGASLDKLIAAMNNRVVAEGEVVGVFDSAPLKTASN